MGWVLMRETLSYLPLSEILHIVGENSRYLYMPQRCRVFLLDISHLFVNAYSEGIFTLMSAKSTIKKKFSHADCLGFI